MKFPDKKTWSDDRAMTINPSSDNYKQGYNDAIKDMKKLNPESGLDERIQWAIKLCEEGQKFCRDNYYNGGQEYKDRYDAVQILIDNARFGSKRLPTVEEINAVIQSCSVRSNEYSKLAEAIHAEMSK